MNHLGGKCELKRFGTIALQLTARRAFLRETHRLNIQRSADGVVIRARLRIQREIRETTEIIGNIELYESARTFFRAKCSRIVTGQSELDAGDSLGSDFCTVEFPAHAVDDANGKLNHITTGDLERKLRFDGEWLHGLNLTDAGT